MRECRLLSRLLPAVLALLLVPGLLVPGAAPAETGAYTRADLEALAAEEGWDELLEHLKDIRPTQRDDGWRALAEKAALGALAESRDEGDPAATYALAKSLRKRFPTLRASEAFMNQRAVAGLEQYRLCFEGKEKKAGDCLGGLEAFVAGAGGGPAVALRAVEVAWPHVRAEFTLPLYHRAFAARPDAPECANRGVARAVARAFHQFDDDDRLAPARAIAFEHCWPALRDRLLDEFSGTTLGGQFHRNTCAGLMDKQALSGLRAELCRSSDK